MTHSGLAVADQTMLPDYLEDRQKYWTALRRLGRVVWVDGANDWLTNAYFLTDPADVLAVLRNPDLYVRYGTKQSLPPRLQRILQPLFVPRALGEIRQELQDRAATIITSVTANSNECEAITVARLITGDAFLTLFRFPPADCDDQKSRVAQSIWQRHGGFLSKLRDDAGKLTDDEVVEVIQRLSNAGVEALQAAIGFGLLELARDPGRRRELCDDPTLIAGFVDDVLRRESPIPTITRVPTAAVTLAGVAIPAGSRLDLCTEAVSAAFGGTLADGHLTWGTGPHRCIANHFTKLVLAAFIGEWLQRIPEFELDADTVPPVIFNRVVQLTRLPLRWPRT